MRRVYYHILSVYLAITFPTGIVITLLLDFYIDFNCLLVFPSGMDLVMLYV